MQSGPKQLNATPDSSQPSVFKQVMQWDTATPVGFLVCMKHNHCRLKKTVVSDSANPHLRVRSATTVICGIIVAPDSSEP